MPISKLKNITIRNKTLEFPCFFPDATKLVIKSVPTADLYRTKTTGLVVNTYHVMHEGLVETLEKLGGVHSFMGFDLPIISDSGGFQVMSLIHANPNNGRITEDGAEFKMTHGAQKKPITTWLTPESCIETQKKIGSDIIMCLDDCTDPKESRQVQELSVERTIRWAKRCKVHFEKIFAQTPLEQRPKLFAIVQGGNIKELRQQCALELIKIGFDGYAYGGWPVDENKNFLTEMVHFVCSVMPDDKPKYAMGVGKPEDIKACYEMGYNMFDCVLPTRDARHKRLYVFDGSEFETRYLNIGQGKYALDSAKVSEFCDCELCTTHSRAYLNHLFRIGDTSCLRLATVHNLRFYSMFLEKLKTL